MKQGARSKKQERGFTLIEIMTSLTIFLTIMTISMGSVLGIFDANRKSQSLRTVMSNLNLAVESMSREIRFGKNYHCGTDGTLTDPRDCASGDSFLSFLSLLSSDDLQVVYRLTGTRLEKSIDGGATYLAVTAPEIEIESLIFNVVGTNVNDNAQPKVLIRIKGKSGSSDKPKTQSSFTLETLVSQRSLDI